MVNGKNLPGGWRSRGEDDIRRTFVEPPPEHPQVADQPGPPPIEPRAPAPSLQAAKPGAPAPADCIAFRPLHRPPMAVLHVMDDAQKAAECVRIRTESFVIGRAEGDLIIPHDAQISSRHAEIVRAQQDDQYRWILRDLNSTNGTFVRATGALLKDDMELMIARQRFRFVAASAPSEEDPDEQPPATDIRQTMDWRKIQRPAPQTDRPCLVGLMPDNQGRRYPLTRDQEWIGRDRQQCSLVLSDEPTVDPRHAGIRRDGQGRWHIEDAGSLNGVWIRVTECPLTAQASFILGEQVFVITFP